MKTAFALAFASFGVTTAAFALTPPNSGASPGPQDPNPPLEAPDLRLPPPCAPRPNIAAAEHTASHPVADARMKLIDASNGISVGGIKCATNGHAGGSAPSRPRTPIKP